MSEVYSYLEIMCTLRPIRMKYSVRLLLVVQSELLTNLLCIFVYYQSPHYFPLVIIIHEKLTYGVHVSCQLREKKLNLHIAVSVFISVYESIYTSDIYQLTHH